MIIRRAVPQDAENLAAFASRMYAQTFGNFTDPDDLEEFLSVTYGASQHREEITSENIRTLIAEFEDQIMGFAQLKQGSAPDCVSGEAPIELWRFYIDKPWQGKGMASDLMDAVIVAAIELGGRTLWLGVWEMNTRAIAFYKKEGFEVVGAKDFWVGNDCQRDRVMVVNLR